MKQPQVISTGDIPGTFDNGVDDVMAFDGSYVIDETDQLPLGEGVHSAHTSIQVDVQFFDLKTGLAKTLVSNITMTYQTTVKYWTIDIADVKAQLVDRHKYVGLVVENGATANMRDFTIDEFAVDNGSFEDTWMRQPYQIEIGAQAWMVWYVVGQLGVGGQETYKAPAYEGGTGTTYATDPAKVTHRGAIVPF